MIRSRFFTVIDRLIAIDVSKSLGSILAVLVLIIVSRRFLKILEKAIEGDVATDTLTLLLCLKTLSAAITLLPAALFMSIIMVFGRMYREQEMTALNAAGMGVTQLYKTLFLVTVPLTLFAGVLSMEVLPWSQGKAQMLIQRDERDADIRGLKPGRFNEYSQGDVVLYAEDFTDEKLRNVFVQQREKQRISIITAKIGYLQEVANGEHYVVLEQGKRYQGIPGEKAYILSEFEQYAVRLQRKNGDEDLKDPREAASSLFLWFSPLSGDKAELQRRISIPCGILILTLLAVPLARVAPRGGAYSSMISAFLIYLLYENLQKVSQGLIMRGTVSFALGSIGVYVGMLALIIYLLGRQHGWSWLQYRIKEGR